MGSIAAIFSAILWAGDLSLLDRSGMLVVAVLHDCFGFTFLFTVFLLAKNKTRVINALRSINTLINIALLGLFCNCLAILCFVFAIKFISPSFAACISATYPIFGVFLARIFLQANIGQFQKIGFLICIGANIFLIGNIQFSQSNLIGIFLAFISALCWGSESIIAQKSIQKTNLNSFELLLFRQYFSSIFGLILLFCFQDLKEIEALNNNTLLNIAMAGICGVLSYIAYYYAIAKIGAIKAMGLNMTYPAFMVAFTKEWSILFIAVVVFIGAYMVNLKGGKCKQ